MHSGDDGGDGGSNDDRIAEGVREGGYDISSDGGSNGNGDSKSDGV